MLPPVNPANEQNKPACLALFFAQQNPPRDPLPLHPVFLRRDPLVPLFPFSVLDLTCLHSKSFRFRSFFCLFHIFSLSSTACPPIAVETNIQYIFPSHQIYGQKEFVYSRTSTAGSKKIPRHIISHHSAMTILLPNSCDSVSLSIRYYQSTNSFLILQPNTWFKNLHSPESRIARLATHTSFIE